MYSTINIFRTIRTPIFTESYFPSLFVSYVRTVHSTVDTLQDIHHQGNSCSTQTLFEYRLVCCSSVHIDFDFGSCGVSTVYMYVHIIPYVHVLYVHVLYVKQMTYKYMCTQICMYICTICFDTHLFEGYVH